MHTVPYSVLLGDRRTSTRPQPAELLRPRSARRTKPSGDSITARAGNTASQAAIAPILLVGLAWEGGASNGPAHRQAPLQDGRPPYLLCYWPQRARAALHVPPLALQGARLQ